MKEKIEQLIEELERDALIGQGSASAYDIGLMHAYKRSVKLLREVLASETNHSRHTPKP